MLTDPRQAIRDRALALGFDAVGFAKATLADHARADLREYLARGYHGDMGWLAAKAERRGEPKALWPEAESVVMLGLSYAPADDPLALLAEPDRGNISVYARGRDYHDVIKVRLREMAEWMQRHVGGELKLFVDTAPVMEKPLAEAAGLGWQGKHTNLVSRTHGSWLFLGEIYTTLVLEADAAETDHCGSCSRCLEVCPTGAFPAAYRLDARRCISYLTIEHKGTIDAELRPLIGNRIYGCDDCLAVCPWNKFAQAANEPGFRAREELASPRLAELAELDDAGFRRLFAGSPVKRTGRDRFLRNVMIAIGNSGDAGLVPIAERRLDDASPLVRAMAVWALSRLVDAASFAQLRARRGAAETDGQVQEEWGRAAPA
ncbi:MAG: tRNA epoxyqueuosine(34) reductase QueG [Proteobacteria bacterium]|nr:tRNA epoxyqueuosine(34) reductase QueG [Pseudomonadota bacterium]MBI3499841.1 tRNA epoxyqueuosine(34) reductase QueG [Pseudomonadota bacterium]